jgi:hypothetical protein
LRGLSRFRHRIAGGLREPNINSTVEFRRPDRPNDLEDAEMFARKAMFSKVAGPAVLATVAALALSTIAPTAASARPWHGHRGGGGAAAAAAFAGIVGTGIAIAASQPRYYDSYDSYYGPAPVYGGPVYYGGPAYYGPGPAHEYYGGRGDASNLPFTPQTGTW